MTNAHCQHCGLEIQQGQYYAESDDDFKARLASGFCRSKCRRLHTPARPERVRPSLALISHNVGRVETVAQGKPHRFASIPYRRFVASYPCCHCLKMGSDPHHHQEPGEGVIGGKVGDDKCVPLCFACHRDIHQYGRGVWDMWGIHPVEVIAYMQESWWQKFGTRPWLNGRA